MKLHKDVYNLNSNTLIWWKSSMKILTWMVKYIEKKCVHANKPEEAQPQLRGHRGTYAVCKSTCSIGHWLQSSVNWPFTCYPYLFKVYVSPHWLLESTPLPSSSLPIRKKNWYVSKDVCLRPYNMLSQIAAFSMAFPECSVPTFRRWTFSAISLLPTTCAPASHRGFFEFK